MGLFLKEPQIYHLLVSKNTILKQKKLRLAKYQTKLFYWLQQLEFADIISIQILEHSPFGIAFLA